MLYINIVIIISTSLYHYATTWIAVYDTLCTIYLD